MTSDLILASGSEIRANLLRNAGLSFDIQAPRVDEESIKQAMQADTAPPRDIADALAEIKAQKISEKFPDALTIGCDQVLDFKGRLLSKPHSPKDALSQLLELRGERHKLHSAAVVSHQGRPIWRHIGRVELEMRHFSDTWAKDYVDRNWNSIRFSVGGYKLEEEGVRLMSRVSGDYFTVLGLPLVELLNFLVVRGTIES